ncbi:MAG: hypothetical protein LBQ89_08225 [Treponema sp.]|jgi:hypothetical protein|nr:hypothetical protein [Treponema sp.]
MGIGPAIFQTAGQRSEHYVPGAYSRSMAVGGEGTGVSANNGVILGRSRGGQPNKLFTFSTKDEAEETLVGGDLLKAVAHAFNPSPEYSPQAIRAMVVNGNTQASTVLTAGNADVLTLKTASWGVIANSITRQIKNGTKAGTKKIVFTVEEIKDEIDNIGKRSIQLQYTGDSPTASLTIDRDGLTIMLSDDVITLSYEDFPTIESLIARLSGSGEFAAIQLDDEANVPSEELDHVENIDIKATVTLTSNFYALYHALEISPWIGKGNVIKVDGAPNKMPDDDDEAVFFDSAVSGSFTVNDWNKTLVALEAENIQMISTHVTDHAVLTLISNHTTAMSNVQNRKERTAILGGAIGETIDDAIAFARSLNNKLVSYCYPAISATSPLTGEAENLPASYFACKLLGMECTVAINEPLTWKNVSVLRFLTKLKISEMEKLIIGGVLCGGTTDDDRLAVIRAMTTHQGRQLQLVERSMVREDLYMNRDIRVQYSKGVGRPGVDKGGDARQVLLDAARSWKGEGLIIPTDKGLNIWDIVIKISGDKTWISFNRNLTAPQNFFFITAYNYIYESNTTVEI